MGSSVKSDFQCAQVKSSIGRVQVNGGLNHTLTEFERLLIKPDQMQMLSMISLCRCR